MYLAGSILTPVTLVFLNYLLDLTGIPSGILVDSKGPRLPVLIGAASLLIGYYPIYLGE